MRRNIDDEPAPEAPAIRTDYRCAAIGCPNVGSIDGRYGINRSGVCSVHWAETDRSRWPELTRRILSDDTIRDPFDRPAPEVDHRGGDPKAWAWQLKARFDAGAKLTPTQRAMFRAVTDRYVESGDAVIP